MPDHFESEVQRFVSETDTKDLTPHVVYQMLKALADDNDTHHDESLEAIEKMRKELSTHYEEAERRDRQITHLRSSFDVHCGDRDAHEHGAVHLEHLANDHAHREGDPEDSDFTKVRAPRYTKEQVVVAVIVFLVMIATQSFITYFIVHALERAYN